MAKHRVKAEVDIVKYEGNVEDLPEIFKTWVVFFQKKMNHPVPVGVYLVLPSNGHIFWCDEEYYQEYYEPI